MDGLKKYIIPISVIVVLGLLVAGVYIAKPVLQGKNNIKTEAVSEDAVLATQSDVQVDSTSFKDTLLKKKRGELPPPDVDLSVLPQQEAYEKAEEIFTHTDEYITKRIKLTGVVDYNTEDEDNIYATVSIENGDGTDQYTFEFVLHDSYIYPQDYPPHEALLTMTGTYSLYDDNGHWVAVLLDGVIEPESFEKVTE